MNSKKSECNTNCFFLQMMIMLNVDAYNMNHSEIISMVLSDCVNHLWRLLRRWWLLVVQDGVDKWLLNISPEFNIPRVQDENLSVWCLPLSWMQFLSYSSRLYKTRIYFLVRYDYFEFVGINLCFPVLSWLGFNLIFNGIWQQFSSFSLDSSRIYRIRYKYHCCCFSRLQNNLN